MNKNRSHPKTLLVGVYTPTNHLTTKEYYFDEFLSLVKTLGLPYDETYFMKVRMVDNNMFFTKGKLEELKAICDQQEIELMVFSEPLAPLQERNLEDALDLAIMDREQLILDIFKKAAISSEGKIQVEMAAIEFLKTRIIGKGRELAQQAGFIGVRGPGETIKEEIKRHFAEKLRQAHKRLDTLERARSVQRQKRLESNIAMFCIIGYTNAGKSSLLNRLTKSDILAENKLFATLDTTTRELFLDGKKKALISDTVGFISNLPHSLIKAFKSTLDELLFADLLIQVIDSANPAWPGQVDVVRETLEQLHVQKPMVYVFNKIDLLNEEQMLVLREQAEKYTPHCFISTKDKAGVIALGDFLQAR